MLQDGAVLVVRDAANSIHVLPGGRRQPDEPPLAALHREVLEETGWTITGVTRLGLLHFRHLAPKPEGYPYPYPDFLQLVYAARADIHVPGAREIGGYEVETSFRSAAEAAGLGIPKSQQLFLNAALQARSMTEGGV